MLLALESAETQSLRARGAEVAALPDGTHALSIPTPDGLFAARALPVHGSRAGARLVPRLRADLPLLPEAGRGESNRQL